MSETAEFAALAASAAPLPTLRALRALDFQGLAEMPAEMEWLANMDNPRRRRAHRIDVADFRKLHVLQNLRW